MSRSYKLALFLFRRDLRLDDNTGLIAAHGMSEKVAPCFIFDPRQVERHEYRSLHALQFMLESLDQLAADLEQRGGRLHLLHGEAPAALAEKLAQWKPQAVFVNRDYTPFSLSRDRDLEQCCRQLGVHFHSYGDALLHEPEEVAKEDGTPYTVYTPFMKTASKLEVRKAQPFQFDNFASLPAALGLKTVRTWFPPLTSTKLAATGGRTGALRLLERLGEFANYDNERDYPALAATTGLSAHNKFGTCSIRELYWEIVQKLGAFHTLIRELFWRDFFTHIAYHFPHVFKGAFHAHYDRIEWGNEKDKFEAWRSGQTGYPIVDAGMRELSATGYMHNRVRMIVASFLTKDLHIDWHWGEKHFAQQLVDYDPAVNNGNWQWAASTGCDAQPYFRIFNPWLQQQKFDAQAEYIKHWIPELAAQPPSVIHRGLADGQLVSGYPAPIVDHLEEKARAQKMYEWAKSAGQSREGSR